MTDFEERNFKNRSENFNKQKFAKKSYFDSQLDEDGKISLKQLHDDMDKYLSKLSGGKGRDIDTFFKKPTRLGKFDHLKSFYKTGDLDQFRQFYNKLYKERPKINNLDALNDVVKDTKITPPRIDEGGGASTEMMPKEFSIKPPIQKSTVEKVEESETPEKEKAKGFMQGIMESVGLSPRKTRMDKVEDQLDEEEKLIKSRRVQTTKQLTDPETQKKIQDRVREVVDKRKTKNLAKRDVNKIVNDIFEEEGKQMSKSRSKQFVDEVYDQILDENPDIMADDTEPPEPPKENVEMKIKRDREIDNKRERQETLDPVARDYLNKFDLIPVNRLDDRAKTIRELKDDINYFFKNFRDNLATERGQYNRLDKNKISELRKIHRRIVGKLNPRARSRDGDDRKNKRIGVVIDPDEYFRQKFNQFLAERAIDGLEPKDLILDVAGNQGDKDRETKDYGSFTVRNTRHGRMAVEREPIFNAIPKTKPEDIKEMKRGYRKKNVPLPTLKTRYYSKVDTAKRELKNNPFLKLPSGKPNLTRINFLY